MTAEFLVLIMRSHDVLGGNALVNYGWKEREFEGLLTLMNKQGEEFLMGKEPRFMEPREISSSQIDASTIRICSDRFLQHGVAPLLRAPVYS